MTTVHMQITVPGSADMSIQDYLASNYDFHYSFIGPVVGWAGYCGADDHELPEALVLQQKLLLLDILHLAFSRVYRGSFVYFVQSNISWMLRTQPAVIRIVSFHNKPLCILLFARG